MTWFNSASSFEIPARPVVKTQLHCFNYWVNILAHRVPALHGAGNRGKGLQQYNRSDCGIQTIRNGLATLNDEDIITTLDFDSSALRSEYATEVRDTILLG